MRHRINFYFSRQKITSRVKPKTDLMKNVKPETAIMMSVFFFDFFFLVISIYWNWVWTKYSRQGEILSTIYVIRMCAFFLIHFLYLSYVHEKIESKQKYITWSILGDRHRSPSLVSLKAVVLFGDLGARWYGSALPYISAVLMFRRTHFCIKSTITIPLSRP